MSTSEFDEVETLLTRDLLTDHATYRKSRTNQNVGNLLLLEHIKQENQKLYNENCLLRNRMKLLHENTDLKTAGIIAGICEWLEDRPSTDIVGVTEDKKLNEENKEMNVTQFLRETNKNSDTNKIDKEANELESQRVPDGRSPTLKFRDPIDDKDIVRTPANIVRGLEENDLNDNKVNKTSYRSTRRRSIRTGSTTDSDENPETDTDVSDVEDNERKHGYVWKRRASNKDIGAPIATSTPAAAFKGTVKKPERAGSEAGAPQYDRPQTAGATNRARRVVIRDKPTQINAEHLDTKPTDQDQESYNVKEIPFKAGFRLLGEIGFQLDRRILNYVYNGKVVEPRQIRKRFYGFTVQNIPDMIPKESVDIETGLFDPKRKLRLQYRYEYVINSLSALGYDVNFHPDFTTYIVNKYGLMHTDQEKKTFGDVRQEDVDKLKHTLKMMVPRYELKDMFVLLDCLSLLSKDEDKPLFVW